MLNNFKITGKLTIGFGIVLALFGVAVFFSWQSISAVQTDVQYLQMVVDNTVKIAVDLTNDISWIRAGIRDLKFSESDEDIERMQSFFSQLRTDLDRGKRMYAQNPSHGEHHPQHREHLQQGSPDDPHKAHGLCDAQSGNRQDDCPPPERC